jgi:hypothetical protein
VGRLRDIIGFGQFRLSFPVVFVGLNFLACKWSEKWGINWVVLNDLDACLRIPGRWISPKQLAEQMPGRYRLEPYQEDFVLITPDGNRYFVEMKPADDEFVEIFASGCGREPLEEEIEGIEHYTFNACVRFPVGTVDLCRLMLLHSNAILDAGGFGVFVDNSGIAHGRSDWNKLAMAPDDGGAFWALVICYGDATSLYSVGMHMLGFRDGEMPRTGNDQADDQALRMFLSYAYRSGAEIKDGEEAGDEEGGTFLIRLVPDTRMPEDAPMYNPLGRYKLVAKGS